MLKLISFDVWNTLLSLKTFYKNISRELSIITKKDAESLEKKLNAGYQKLKFIRRKGDLNNIKIVPITLEMISDILDVKYEDMRRSIIRTISNQSSNKYVIDGAKEVIQSLKNHGYNIAIVGNVLFWPGYFNRILLEKTNLAQFIDKQFYADEIGVSKPDPIIFSKLLSEFKLKPEEVLHVGDSLFEDFVGSLLSLMVAVLIDPKMTDTIKLSYKQAYIIPSLSLLSRVIKEVSLDIN